MQKLLTVLAAAAICLPAAKAQTNVHLDGYAVVVSKEVDADADWKRVVDCLKRKHSGTVITYSKMVEDSLADLKRLFPEYACFVGPPEEITREFVAQVHRLTRRLDDDPYTDVMGNHHRIRAGRCASDRKVRRAAGGSPGAFGNGGRTN